MTEKHPPTTVRALACVLTAAVVHNAPRAAVAAPEKPSSVEAHAAAAIEAFGAGAEQEAKGDRPAAAHHYRDAAEANAAALDALDRSSVDHLELAQTLAKRVIKAYAAGLRVVDDPALRNTAWDWCTGMLASFHVADDPGFAEVQQSCAQWEPPPAVVKPPPLTKKATNSGQPPPELKAPGPSLRQLRIGLSISGAVTGLLLGTTLGVALSRPDRFERFGFGIATGFLTLGGALSTTLYAVNYHRAKRAQDKLRVAVSWQPGGLGLTAQGRF